MPLHCKHCNSEIELKEAIAESPYSWPNLQSFWHVCRECGKGNHIRVEDGTLSVIEVVGAPGPEWKYVERERNEELFFRIDPEFLHIILGTEQFAIEARK